MPLVSLPRCSTCETDERVFACRECGMWTCSECVRIIEGREGLTPELITIGETVMGIVVGGCIHSAPALGYHNKDWSL